MIWKPVKNYENFYEVSTCGYVRKTNNGSCIGQWLNSNGYSCVRLSRPRAVILVHRLVAEVFLENPKNLPFVNHIDCIRHNNHSWNLEWCTQMQNLAHSAQLGRMQRDYWKGKRSPNAKLSDENILKIKEEYELGEISWGKLGKKYNASKRTIGRILKNESYKLPSSV